MEVLDAIRARRSIGRLAEPGPTPEQLDVILQAAACAPDHGTMRPWRFVVVRDKAMEAFGDALAAATEAECRDRGEEADPRKVEKDRGKVDRAPVVVAVACEYRENRKVPAAEQRAAVVAAAQNACLAATGLGLGSMWRTGPNATNPHVVAALGLPEGCDIVGFLWFGTVEDEKAKPPNEPDLDGVVSYWSPPA